MRTASWPCTGRPCPTGSPGTPRTTGCRGSPPWSGWRSWAGTSWSGGRRTPPAPRTAAQVGPHVRRPSSSPATAAVTLATGWRVAVGVRPAPRAPAGVVDDDQGRRGRAARLPRPVVIVVVGRADRSAPRRATSRPRAGQRSMSVTLPPFQHLVDAHWRDVARLAHSLSGPGEGDDVAQQAWTQALAAYPRLKSAANLRSWLMTITARCAMDGHRSRRRRPLPVDELPEPSGPDSGPEISSLPRIPFCGNGFGPCHRDSARPSPCATSPIWTMQGSPRPWARRRPRPDGWSATRWPPYETRLTDEYPRVTRASWERRLRAGVEPPGLRPPDCTATSRTSPHDTAVGRLLLAVRADGRLLASSFAPDDAAEDAVLQRLSRLVSPRVVRDARALDGCGRRSTGTCPGGGTASRTWRST